MTTYPIKEWNGILPKNATFPFPMIFIKPDIPLQELVSNSDGIPVQVSISGTSIYDQTFAGTLQSTLNYPNFRPNFFKETGYIAITLLSNWRGYPIQNGSVTIADHIQLSEPVFDPQPIFEPYKEINDCRLTQSQVFTALFAILIVFVGLMSLSKRTSLLI
jgi:hypothetical protein